MAWGALGAWALSMARGFWPLADAGMFAKRVPGLSDAKDREVPLPRLWVRGYTSPVECRWNRLVHRRLDHFCEKTAD